MPEEPEPQPMPTPRDEFLTWMRKLGVEPLAQTIDHGNTGFLIALPTSGRLVSVYFTAPMNTFLEK